MKPLSTYAAAALLSSWLAAFSYALAGLSSGPPPGWPSPLKPPPGRAYYGYVALGDSYSAGAGLFPPFDNFPDYDGQHTCGRSVNAWPKVFYERYYRGNACFEFLACSHATEKNIIRQTKDILRCVYKDDHGYVKNKFPDLITMTIGGDDPLTDESPTRGAFLDVIVKCVLLYHPYRCLGAIHYADGLIAESVDRIKKFLHDVKRPIPGHRPTVVLVGYPQFWNPGGSCGPSRSDWHLPTMGPGGEMEKINKLVRYMNGNLSRAALESGAPFLDVDKLFEGHRQCDNQSYLEITWNEDYKGREVYLPMHPTRLGHIIIAQGLAVLLGW